MGANVLVKFKIVFLIGGNFLQLGAFFLSWGQKIILGSRKSAILGTIWTPELGKLFIKFLDRLNFKVPQLLDRWF